MSATATDITLSAQIQLRHRLDLIAHNIANGGTSGFQERLALPTEEVVSPVNGQKYSFVSDGSTMRNLALGAFKRTDDPLHVYLNGPGYFSVQTSNGTAYTRSGIFTRSDSGQVVTAQGYPVLDSNNSAIIIPDDVQNVAVGKDGTISDGDTVLGQIGVFTFANDQLMEEISDTLFQTDQAPTSVPDAQVIQNGYEGSNMNPIMGMTQMMNVINAYKQTQQWIEGYMKLNSTGIQNLVKIPPAA